MERLTYEKSRNRWDEGKYPTKYTSRHTFQEVVARLAAYEDTELEPEEVTAIKHALMGQEIAKITEFDGISVKHMIELAQAETDGRLVVLPCKKGDTLWSYYDYPHKGISRIVVTAVSTLNGVTVINTDNYGVMSAKDVGKTVFLTREEAEAALKKREADNEAD